MTSRAEPPIHLESVTPEPHGGWRFVVRLDDGQLRGFTFVPDQGTTAGAGHESAWLIETLLGGTTPAWLSRDPCYLFSTAHNAVRFDSKQDAEAVIDALGKTRGELFATEHLFCGSPAPATEPGRFEADSVPVATNRSEQPEQDRSEIAAAPTAGGGERYAKSDDESGVDMLAAAMKAKLHRKRREGYAGWQDREVVTDAELWDRLRSHIEKGDPVDVANFAMMLFVRQQEDRIAGRPVSRPAPVSPGTEAGEWPKGEPSIGLKPLLVAMKHLADEDTHTGPPGATGETLIEAARWIHSLRTAKETAEAQLRADKWNHDEANALVSEFDVERNRLKALVASAEATARGMRELVRAAFDDGYASAKREPMVTVSGALYDRSDTKRRLAALDGAQ